MDTYDVEIQASTGYEFKSQTFTIAVAAPEGCGQAERRGIRRAIERAAEWNAEHPEAITPRLTDRDAYRVVAIRAHVAMPSTRRSRPPLRLLPPLLWWPDRMARPSSLPWTSTPSWPHSDSSSSADRRLIEGCKGGGERLPPQPSILLQVNLVPVAAGGVNRACLGSWISQRRGRIFCRAVGIGTRARGEGNCVQSQLPNYCRCGLPAAKGRAGTEYPQLAALEWRFQRAPWSVLICGRARTWVGKT